VAPALFAGSDRRADAYQLIGAGSDLVAGAVVRPGVSDGERGVLVRTLADAAFAEARRLGLTGAALYLRNEQIDHFGVGRSRARVDELARLDVVDGGDEAYLASLDAGRRSVVVRDWRKLGEHGLRSETVPAAAVVDEAAPLVVNVKRRHGVLDHPRLAAMRLRRWADEPFGERLAFVVRGGAGELLAVCFGCRHGRVLEMLEIGLVDESALRHLAYVEAMVYGPRRYAAQSGCRELHLGLGSAHPKCLRGARMAPVWAVTSEGN
jgi:hypothetical protein